MMSYIDETSSSLCAISLIGRVGFTVAANFWIIFITRLVYKEALAPGKYLNLVRFVSKNIVLAYIPSLVLCSFLLAIIYIGDSSSEAKCWTIILDTQLMDYVVYGSSFIFPNLITSIIICANLYWYRKLPSHKWTIFLLFPIIALIFSAYYLVIKIYLFTRDGSRVEGLEIPLLG